MVTLAHAVSGDTTPAAAETKHQGDEATDVPPTSPDWSVYYATPRLRDGREISIRPIRPDDAPLMVQYHRTLSDRTVYLRYFEDMDLTRRTDPERIQSVCTIDFKQTLAVVAEWFNPDTEQREIVGCGRLLRLFPDEAEFAILVSDAFQNTGLGTHLLNRLVNIGRNAKVKRVIGYILPENIGMQAVCRKLGFRVEMNRSCKEVEAVLEF